jgi:transposase-like protein
MAADQDGAFGGRYFTAEVILWARRWYLAFPISYRDLAAMLSDRGVAVDHTNPRVTRAKPRAAGDF